MKAGAAAGPALTRRYTLAWLARKVAKTDRNVHRGSADAVGPCLSNTVPSPVVLWPLLAGFLIIECFIPLKTAVQIGADEGFEMAKATLWLSGHHLYTEVWNDQPPLHTFLVVQSLRHFSPSILIARLLTVAFSALLLSSIFNVVYRISGLRVAGLTTALVIASPGFLELSSSCMLEIPALATALRAICLLLSIRENKWFVGEVLSGLVFGLAIQMKLVPVIYLSLVALIIYLLYQRVPMPAKRMMASGGVFTMALLVTYVATDVLIERGAFLLHFQQSWASHFAPAKSFEYGSASEHPFKWGLLLKNWDITALALPGLILLFLNARRSAFTVIPIAWFGLCFAVFGIHRPWWPYYYVHTAIPLCWCAGFGATILFQRMKGHRWALAGLILFSLCAASWMGARIYFEIANLRRSPQIYSSPVIAQMKRFKPFTEWLYADQLMYSFYTGIPIVPSLAVLPVKRMWSGEMTNARLEYELKKYRPGLIVLFNDSRDVPFNDLLQAEYQLVYMDADNRLYALKSIAKKPRR